jgi:BirA family biotin operon repressor/biotin-[acetyl-CoA-carboxylase] ligase
LEAQVEANVAKKTKVFWFFFSKKNCLLLMHLPSGWRIATFEELVSTQDIALVAARAGENGKLAVIARRQTGGRGRAGRVWQAPAGNLNFSALIRPAGEGVAAGAWALLAGVAVLEAASSFGVAGLMLKWPNDLLLGGAKVGGVLVDSALTAGGAVDWVVIGVGVNLAAAPEVVGRATACLADAGVRVSPEEFAAALMRELDRWQAAGLAAVRPAWLGRAHPAGTCLRVQRGQDVIEGRFVGLTEDGRLRIEGGGDVASGEVEVI